MKKLFISQPMRGKTDEEILATREKAIAKAKELVGEPVEALETFFQGAPAGAKPLWYIGESIKYLGEADVAFFAKGWEDARGCRIEHECAKEYNVNRIEETEED